MFVCVAYSHTLGAMRRYIGREEEEEEEEEEGEYN